MEHLQTMEFTMTLRSPLTKVFIALVLACIAGYFAGSYSILGVPLAEIFGLIGELFLNALSLVVIPLVASSIILGAARMGSDESIGSLGVKTFGYFILTTTLAVLIGYAAVTFLSPGLSTTEIAPSSLNDTAMTANIQTLEQLSESSAFIKFKQLLLKILPPNIISAASQGQMISLIIFCLLFGYFSMKIEAQASTVLMAFWRGVFQVMMKITHLFMRALPIGVFGLVAKVVATSGLDAFQSVAWFSATVLLAFGIYLGIVLPILLKFIGRVSPVAFYSAMSPALLTAFSTSSSAAALPAALDCLEKRGGVSNRICGFTVPLGTAVSLSGSAMYECIAVIFIAQVYGIHLTMSTQILVIVMSILTSFGLAGIPSACLFAVVVILQTIGLPVEGIGLVLTVERILDMFRTATNVSGNTTCAVLVAKSEKEDQILNPNLSTAAKPQ